MKTFITVSGTVSVLCLLISVTVPATAYAATTPSLGAASSYAILANTYINTTAGTIINGDIGFVTPPAIAPLGTHANYGAVAPYAAAGSAQFSAKADLASQACTFTFAPGDVDLSTDITHGSVGIYAPGVYCSTGAMTISGALTLSGSGTYIFRPVGTLTSAPGSTVTLSGTSSEDVFWTPSLPTVLGANTTFAGTVIDCTAISVGANTTWAGRALSFCGTVTTAANVTICPSCIVPPLPPVPHRSHEGTITLTKIVINDNGGTKTVADFPLFINGTSVVSGETNTFPATGGLYIASETSDPQYVGTFSGDCDISGQMNLNSGDTKTCILTNDDIAPPTTSGGPGPRVVVVPPPVIDVQKVAEPTSLPSGPGLVTYTYTLRNTGTMAVSNVTMVDDSCSSMMFVSGDADADHQLDVNEIWTFRCAMVLFETHTNIVVATAMANGQTATAMASATVMVSGFLPGFPNTGNVSPLIHVTKVPFPLSLPPEGGMVTYTEQISNPGVIALSNVGILDDKCDPVMYVLGDVNGDGKLDPTETWVYRCKTNLTQTTTNTVTVSGEANGVTVRDSAVATVVVEIAPPTLPRTGFAPAKTHPVSAVLPVVPASLANTMRLKIPAIKVNAAIETVAHAANDGSMGTPKNVRNVGWYEYGPHPGEIGSAVIDGHVNAMDGSNAVFSRLYQLKPGDKIVVASVTGEESSFVVRELRTYNAAADANNIFNANDSNAHLNLITCFGTWDAQTQQYTKRLVVFADKEIQS